MSDDDEQHERAVRRMMSVAPPGWDPSAGVLAQEIRRLLGSVSDVGTTVESGVADGQGHLWVTVDGVQFFIQVSKSKAQRAKEGAKTQDAPLSEPPPGKDCPQCGPYGDSWCLNCPSREADAG